MSPPNKYSLAFNMTDCKNRTAITSPVNAWKSIQKQTDNKSECLKIKENVPEQERHGESQVGRTFHSGSKEHERDLSRVPSNISISSGVCLPRVGGHVMTYEKRAKYQNSKESSRETSMISELHKYANFKHQFTSLRNSRDIFKQTLPKIGIGKGNPNRNGPFSNIYSEHETANATSAGVTNQLNGNAVSTSIQNRGKPSLMTTPFESHNQFDQMCEQLGGKPNLYTTMHTIGESRKLAIKNNEGEKSDFVLQSPNELSRFKAIDMRSSYHIPRISFAKNLGWNIQNSAIRSNQLRSSNHSTIGHSENQQAPKFSNQLKHKMRQFT